MARRKKSEDEPCGNWMDTYGDMVTLLLTFFVLLYSMADINQEKFARFVRAFTSQRPDVTNLIMDQDPENEEGTEYPQNRAENPSDTLANVSLEELTQMAPGDFDQLYEYLKAYVEKSGMAGSVEVQRQGDGVVFIRFQDNIFFNPDEALLKYESQPLLEFLGSCLKSVEEQIMTININGHTADPGIANYGVSDWRLSAERAANVAIYFEEQQEIDPKKLLPIGYGKNFPVADNATPEGRERNRRVDMLIISDESTLTADQILSSILDGTFDPDQYPGEGGVSDVLRPPATQDGQSQDEPGPSEASQEPSAPPEPQPGAPSQEPSRSAGAPPASSQGQVIPYPDTVGNLA